jgi:hypothetical protein
MSGVNPQERLSHTEAEKWFLAGFIEGEGSYCASIKTQASSRFGLFVDPEFYLYQHEHGRALLERAQRMFNTGRITRKVGNEVVLVFCIDARRILKERVIPFLLEYVYPFSAKQKQILAFAEIVDLLERKSHFTAEGLIRIVEKAYAMNPGSKGKERKQTLQAIRERILRGHTPDIQPPG